MDDSKDLVIWRLFAEQDDHLPADDFMLKLGRRMERQKRARRFYRVLAVVACLVMSALVAPFVALATSNLIDLTAIGLRSANLLTFHPLLLLLAGATVLGGSPAIYLWRTGKW